MLPIPQNDLTRFNEVLLQRVVPGAFHSLLVQNFNFEDAILTVHGKGDKDRAVPLPQRIIPKLKDRLKTVSALHEKDLSAGYSGVFLKDSLEKKYPAAAKEFIRQWFFPQKNL